jgi:RNA polymerase sigma-70 factor (ECF subfamily)
VSSGLTAARKLDAALLDGCRRRDREAFRVFYEAYKDRVYSIAFHFTGDETAARDLAQDVFVKLYAVLPQFRGDSDFDTWLYRLVANACMDEHRKRRRWLPLEDEAAVKPSNAESQEQGAMRSELATTVRLAVGELDPRFRLPVLLRYLQGLSYDQIAEALGCSKGTVASRLNRAHKLLAKRLGHLRSDLATGGRHV